MSERSQTLMRTRCPACDTVFRVTSEQLRQRAGKVRCGHCQFVFNAFDQLLPDEPTISAAAVSERDPLPPASLSEGLPGNHGSTQHVAPQAVSLPALATEATGSHPLAFENATQALTEPAEVLIDQRALSEGNEVASESLISAENAQHELVADSSDLLPVVDECVSKESATNVVEDLEQPEDVVEETLEQSTQAARDAGLVAVRELADPTAYNRWAEGALAGNRLGSIGDEVQKRPAWPFLLVAFVLLVVLVAQVFLHYRTELSVRYPVTRGLYDALGLQIPLPRNVDLITIESSDLQSDAARGLFVLQATIKNRAPFAQGWPTLELSLTDVTDNVVSRRAMYAAEYLPPGTSAESFGPNEELGVRLWVEAKGIGAAGYRVYLFYP